MGDPNNECFFCKKSADADSTLISHLYKVTDRKILTRKVEYKQRDIAIPRCRSCKEAQTQSRAGGNKFAKYIFPGAVIAGMVIGREIGKGDTMPILAGAGIGVVVGIIFTLKFGVNRAKTLAQDGVLDDSYDTLKSYPGAAEFLNDGWSFIQPTA